jgi:hypothetical protein
MNRIHALNQENLRVVRRIVSPISASFRLDIPRFGSRFSNRFSIANPGQHASS